MTARPDAPEQFSASSEVVEPGRVGFGTRLSRLLGRYTLRLRYLLTQQHRHRRLTLERAGGRDVLVLPNVFNPVLFKSGAFLAETLDERLVPPGSSVLDMGTGTGIGAIAACGFAERVVAVDINPDAVRCTRINALLHGVENRVDVREGDLFEPLEPQETFDVILFNPPYFEGEPADAYDRSWRSPDLAERFAATTGGYLSGTGMALLVLSSDGDCTGFLNAFRRHGYVITTIAERRHINETLTVYGLQRNG